MTAFHSDLPNILSVDMSYDEIDFAERLGEDDIDIDIDLETGQNDEDYILEDVKSDAGHEEAFIVNDDVMIDDENVSYPMDDVDNVQEEHIEMQDADLSDMPATGFNNAGIDNDLGRNDPPLPADVAASETVIDELYSHGLSSEVIENEHVPVKQDLVEETVVSDKRTMNADSTLSPTTFPSQQDTGGHIGADSHLPITDPGYSTSFKADPSNEDATDSVAISGTSTATGRIEDGSEVQAANADSILLAVEKVIVVYRDAEYALCSLSESDDPDTFFLKDASLVTGSLAGLIAGFREVIQEDLGPEDELCLTAEDLGIEISETCMSVHDVNFASIIELHWKLQRNDGIEIPGPLYVTLGTKPDFAKRLANLIAGAADGKGMSDLISWDEESEDRDENVEESEKHEVTNKHHENDLAGEGIEEQQLPENSNSKQNIGTKTEGAHIPGDQIREEVPEEDSRFAKSSPVPSGPEVSEYSKDGLDEDGDFIDYEDEEYDQSPEIPASANIDSGGKQYDNKSEHDQYSPTTAPEEGGHHDEFDSNSSPNQSDQYQGKNANHEADSEDGDFSGYPEPDEYEVDEGLTHEEMGQEPYISYDGIQEEDEGRNGNVVTDVIFSSAEEALGPQELDHQPEATKTRYEDEVEEIEYTATEQGSLGVEQTGSSIVSATDNQGSKTLAAVGHDQDDDEISYEEVDVPGSNESEHTLIADESVPNDIVEVTKQENNDEINYDTDDQQELNQTSSQKASTEASPVSNGHTGKRQRADAEDATDRASKQSKRPRS